MVGGDPLEEALERLAGLQAVAGRSWLTMKVQNPGLVASDLRTVSAELRRLKAQSEARDQQASALMEALRNAIENLHSSSERIVGQPTRSQLFEALEWIEKKLEHLFSK